MSFKFDFDLFLSQINNAFNSHINNYLFFNKNNLNRFGKIIPITYLGNKIYDIDDIDESDNDENNKENKINNKKEESEIKIDNDFFEKYKFNYDLETGLNDIELGKFDNH